MDELVKELRDSAEWADRLALLMGRAEGDTHAPIMRKAADAIEELSRLNAEITRRELKLRMEKPRWIPVTERLPEHDKNVLICYEWTGRSRTVYREVGIASIEELECDPTEMFRPLYWMPLPEPPKEET